MIRLPVRFRVGSAHRVLTWATLGLAVGAVIEVLWIFLLGVTLPGMTSVRNWSITWIGLDSTQCLGLLAVALLIHRRSRHLSAVAAATAALFAADAWFDVMTASAGRDWADAVTLACAFEIPVALLCGVTAVAAARWTDRPARAGAAEHT